MADHGMFERPVGLRFIGDWGGANLTRVCGWLAHELHERTPGDTYSVLRTGDAGVGNLHALGRGEVDVAVVTPSAAATLAVRGTGPFAGSGYPFLRALGELPHPDRLLFAARAELGLTSIADLVEKRPALRLATALDGPGGSFAGYAAQRVLTLAGLPPAALEEWGGEIVPRDLPFECVAELDAGADAVFHEAVMTPWWRSAAERHALSFLSFAPDVLAAAAKELACPPITMPAGALHGMDAPVETVEFCGYLIVVRAELADDVAELLTAIIVETADRFVGMNYAHIPSDRSPIAHPITVDGLVDTPIALHPGAAAYYERPSATATAT
jgi:TRAP-type uncharacterized transport system substrate-binding protein